MASSTNFKYGKASVPNNRVLGSLILILVSKLPADVQCLFELFITCNYDLLRVHVIPIEEVRVSNIISEEVDIVTLRCVWQEWDHHIEAGVARMGLYDGNS